MSGRPGSCVSLPSLSSVPSATALCFNCSPLYVSSSSSHPRAFLSRFRPPLAALRCNWGSASLRVLRLCMVSKGSCRWTRPCTDGRRQRAGQLRTEYLGPKYLPREVRRARTAQGRSTGGSALGGARPTRTNLGQLSCERLRAIDLARHWVLSATSMKPHDSRQLLPGAQRHIELPRRVTVGLLLLGSRSRSEPMRERAPA